VSDYYDLLGVEPGADKDAIKSAYRDRLEDASQAERAKLNKAWNVLSDPVQRERYDGARAEGWLDDAEADVEVVDAAPRRQSASRGGGGGRERTPRPPAAPRPEPDVVLPEGMVLAENRNRGNALLIDFLVLFVVYALALALVLPALVKAQYPTESKQIDAINKQIDTLDKQKSSVDSKAGKAKGQAQKDLQAQSKQIQKKIDNKNSDINALAKHFQGFVMALYGVLTVVLLLIVAPLTALTGQTIGQRFRKVRVVRQDGSPVGWGGAILRFLPPIALAVFLPQIGALIGLGMVLWFLRDRNRQGFHDKLAKTLVVAAD
jgi:curved DNA-binding protein CbpA